MPILYRSLYVVVPRLPACAGLGMALLAVAGPARAADPETGIPPACSLLRHWALDIFPDFSGPLAPDRDAGFGLATTAHLGDPRIYLGSRGERMWVGNAARLDRVHSSLRLRQPLADSGFSLLAGTGREYRSIQNGSSVPILSSAAGFSMVDAGARWRGALAPVGRIEIGAEASLDSPFAGLAGIAIEHPRYELHLSRRRSYPRDVELVLPTEIPTPVRQRFQIDGLDVGGGIRLPAPRSLRFRAEAGYQHGSVVDETDTGQRDMVLSPIGSSESWMVAWRVGDTRNRELVFSWSQIRNDAEGTFALGRLRAGKLFFATGLARGLALEGNWVEGGNHWTVSTGQGTYDGALSIRLETWPHVEIWEQLGVVAYRLKADFEGTSYWAQLRRIGTGYPHHGWRWTVGAALHDFRAGTQDWLVPFPGIGRMDEARVSWQAESVLVLGGDVGRPFSVFGGTFLLELTGAVPVLGSASVTRTGPQEPGPRPEDRASLLLGIDASMFW